MKSLVILSALAVGNAFILPDEQVFQQLAVESRPKAESLWDRLPSPKKLTEKLSEKFEHVAEDAAHTYDELWDSFTEKANDVSETAEHYTDEAYETAFDVKGWLAGSENEHHRPPPHHKRPHHRGPHHGHKPNQTIYQLISKSKYTTKLAKLIDEYDDLVKLLNGTSANFTVFAPSDKAFDKIPKHAPKPSKEFLKKLLTYHVSTDFYPAFKVLYADTIPTALEEKALGGQQRISVRLGGKGLTLNFYAGVIAPNIFATNGVIHGIESILVPPPSIVKILELLPGEFSTLLLALEKAGAGNSSVPHTGATLFAPSNFAWKKLGPGPNAFLFSEHGRKYLKALLRYHASINETLYSDALYTPDSAREELSSPRRNVHVDLPTMLKGRSLPVDIARFGPYINVRVNGYSRVTTKNGIAKDGVIQVVGDVLIPPKQLDGKQVVETLRPQLTAEELQERLEPYVEDEDEEQEEVPADDEETAASFKWEM